jgi:DNA-directed RNA polymerase II subunit RPB2
MIRHEGLIAHHIDSFNKFITHHAPHIVNENSILVLECSNMRHVVKFQDVHVKKPTVQEDDGCIRDITPQECILRKQTYAASLYSNVLHVEEYKKEILHPDGSVEIDWIPTKRTLNENVLLGEIPAMVRSCVCHTSDEPDILDPNAPYEYGGNFIISGSEKVLVPQEKPRINRAFIYKSNKVKYRLMAEVRSCHEDKLRSTSTLTIRMTDVKGIKRFWVDIPYIKKPVPIFAVFRLLGFGSMEEAARCVVTAGRLSGRKPFPRGSKWTQPAVRALHYWIMTVFKNEVWCRCTKGQGAGGDEAEDKEDSKGKYMPDFSLMSYEEIIEWIGCIGTIKPTREERYKYVHHLMANEFLPHVGVHNTPDILVRKRRYFAYIVYRLALCGYEPQLREKDDKDHYGNKQIETSGMLMSLCLRQNWRTLLRKMLNSLRKDVKANKTIHAGEMVSGKTISDNFKFALATGKWGTKKGASTQTGISQPMKRMCHMTWLAHLRKLNVPLNREGKNPKPRMLRFSHWGIACPATTPEGQPCGLIKALALGARVTTGTRSDVMANVILYCLDPDEFDYFPGSTYDYDTGNLVAIPEVCKDPKSLDDAMDALDAKVLAHDSLSSCVDDQTTTLMVNGIPMALVKNPLKVVQMIREMRRSFQVPPETSVVYDPQLGEVYVTCDAGGTRRPLYIIPSDGSFADTAVKVRHILDVYGGSSVEVWRQLLLHKCIEYVDKHEEEQSLLVWSDPQLPPPEGEAWTHCEIHPLVIYGESTSLIPFSNHNPPPRNTYQSSMGQAAIGVPGVELYNRTSSHVLFYPARPLVSSFVEEAMGLHALPAGQNIVIAILAHGSNQEDSLVFNQAAIDAGLFRTFYMRTYSEDVQKTIGIDAERFAKPDEFCTGLKAANYDKLCANGFPMVGERLKDGDVVIGKQMSIHNLASSDKNATIARDQSATIKRFDREAVVQSVTLSSTCNERKQGCVHMRSVRVPREGDKFASRHAQKGVIGKIVADVDMPFSAKTGIRPSALMTPLAFPSRMTVAHLIEMLVGKAAALKGHLGDGTPFEEVDIDGFGKMLEECGFSKSCSETLIDGVTGKPMEANVYMGPIFYQRLRQMVDDKYHARARGQRQVTTRQATEGRAREGGLRLGEMERDCIAANGATQITKDRFLDQSDDYITVVCSICGLIAEPARAITSKRKRSMMRASKPYCRRCRRSDGVYKVRMPYNYKLLVQEVMGMGAAMRFELEEPMYERDLETCASVGLHVPPDAEVVKTKRMKRYTTIQRDPTLLTGAYSSLVQDDVVQDTSGRSLNDLIGGEQ